jgi:hypothetical protein
LAHRGYARGTGQRSHNRTHEVTACRHASVAASFARRPRRWRDHWPSLRPGAVF